MSTFSKGCQLFQRLVNFFKDLSTSIKELSTSINELSTFIKDLTTFICQHFKELLTFFEELSTFFKVNKLKKLTTFWNSWQLFQKVDNFLIRVDNSLITVDISLIKVHNSLIGVDNSLVYKSLIEVDTFWKMLKKLFKVDNWRKKWQNKLTKKMWRIWRIFLVLSSITPTKKNISEKLFLKR